MSRRKFSRWMLVAGVLTSMAIWLPNGSAVAGEMLHPHRHSLPTVPPIDELEILDPRVDPEGKARALVLMGANGLKQIETPPTVIVHRYYYTGARDFQGPMLPGGPVILAVNSPATGEQVYVEVLLPPGAPRITYRQDRIIYEYRAQTITVNFGRPGPLGLGRHAKPVVSIRRHSPAAKDAAERAEQNREHRRDWWTRTGIPHATHHVADSGKQAVNHTADTIHTVGEFVTAPVVAVWQATPLSSLTSSSQVKQPAFNEPGIR